MRFVPTGHTCYGSCVSMCTDQLQQHMGRGREGGQVQVVHDWSCVVCETVFAESEPCLNYEPMLTRYLGLLIVNSCYCMS